MSRPAWMAGSSQGAPRTSASASSASGGAAVQQRTEHLRDRKGLEEAIEVLLKLSLQTASTTRELQPAVWQTVLVKQESELFQKMDHMGKWYNEEARRRNGNKNKGKDKDKAERDEGGEERDPKRPRGEGEEVEATAVDDPMSQPPVPEESMGPPFVYMWGALVEFLQGLPAGKGLTEQDVATIRTHWNFLQAASKDEVMMVVAHCRLYRLPQHNGRKAAAVVRGRLAFAARDTVLQQALTRAVIAAGGECVYGPPPRSALERAAGQLLTDMRK